MSECGAASGSLCAMRYALCDFPLCLARAPADWLPQPVAHLQCIARCCLQGKMYHSDCLSISLEAFGPLPAGKLGVESE